MQRTDHPEHTSFAGELGLKGLNFDGDGLGSRNGGSATRTVEQIRYTCMYYMYMYMK